MDMTFIKFRENLAERVLEAQLKGYFLIVIPDRMVRVDRYLGCVYTPGVLSRVKRCYGDCCTVDCNRRSEVHYGGHQMGSTGILAYRWYT